MSKRFNNQNEIGWEKEGLTYKKADRDLFRVVIRGCGGIG